MDKISLVVPCYNEEETIRIFYNEVLKYESQLDAELEFCFVDDGRDYIEHWIFIVTDP